MFIKILVKQIYYILIFIFFVNIAFAKTVKTISINKHKLTVNLVTSKKSTIKYFWLNKPTRWVIDIPNKQLTTKLAHKYKCPDNYCTSIRSSTNKLKSRLVIEFKNKPKVHQQVIKLKNHRFKHIWQFSSKLKLNKITTIKSQNKLRDIIIVVDPGHGGKDPGALGHHLREKDITLAISKQLVNNLNKQLGLKAYLTRNKDVYLTLRQRLGVARKLKADCFLAIHADASRSRYSQGASVYALSARGAANEANRWLSRTTQQEFIGGAKLNIGSSLLSGMLMDLQQSFTASSSFTMGSYLLNGFKGKIKLHSKKVGKAAFVVLKSPDITSLLVETGFISNRIESAKLINPKYQAKLVKIITQAIVKYYTQHGVDNTLIAQKYIWITVKPRDSLYKISKKYQVSLANIYQANPGIKAKTLTVGQKIKIIR